MQIELSGFEKWGGGEGCVAPRHTGIVRKTIATGVFNVLFTKDYQLWGAAQLSSRMAARQDNRKSTSA